MFRNTSQEATLNLVLNPIQALIEDIEMPCLFALMAGFFPRLATLFVWLARPAMFSAAFGGSWLWPLLGVIFLPFTTLFYVILWSPGVGLTTWDWVWLFHGSGARRDALQQHSLLQPQPDSWHVIRHGGQVSGISGPRRCRTLRRLSQPGTLSQVSGF